MDKPKKDTIAQSVEDTAVDTSAEHMKELEDYAGVLGKPIDKLMAWIEK